MSDIRIRLPRLKWPKSWSSMEDPIVLLERNLYGRQLGRTVVGKAIRQNYFGKSSYLGLLNLTHREKGLFLSVCVG